jgi:hypothetical protein
MRSIRAKSLLIDFLFTPIPLPHGDDAGCLIARCVGDDHQTPSQQTQSDAPPFSIVEAIIFERDARLLRGSSNGNANHHLSTPA